MKNTRLLIASLSCKCCHRRPKCSILFTFTHVIITSCDNFYQIDSKLDHSGRKYYFVNCIKTHQLWKDWSFFESFICNNAFAYRVIEAKLWPIFHWKNSLGFEIACGKNGFANVKQFFFKFVYLLAHVAKMIEEHCKQAVIQLHCDNYNPVVYFIQWSYSHSFRSYPTLVDSPLNIQVLTLG